MILKAGDLSKEITIEVTVIEMPKFLFRVFLFKKLLKFAVWIGGFKGVEIKGRVE